MLFTKLDRFHYQRGHFRSAANWCINVTVLIWSDPEATGFYQRGEKTHDCSFYFYKLHKKEFVSLIVLSYIEKGL